MRIARLLCLPFLLLSVPTLARPLDPISRSDWQERLEALEPAPLPNAPVSEAPRQIRGCLVQALHFDLVDPRSLETRKQKTTWVVPDHQGPVPFVILIPTIEGTTILEKYIAGKLCWNGIGSVIADVNKITLPTQLPAQGIEDARFRLSIHTLRNIIDHIERHPRLLRHEIGLMGLSLGGITASFLAGVEPRLKATVIAAGGGNLPSVLSYSDHSVVAKLRRQRMQAMGLTSADQYEDWLRQSLLFDPLYFASPLQKDSLMMIMVDGDLKVPFENQVETWQAFGQPQRMLFTWLGHAGSLIEMTFLYMNDVIEFLHGKFGLAKTRMKSVVPLVTTLPSGDQILRRE